MHKYLNLDLTRKRQIHLIGGIFCWIFARLALLTGTKIHKLNYGPMLYMLLIIETLIAICIFAISETVMFFQRKNWRVKLSPHPVRQGRVYDEILGKLRRKGIKKIFLIIF